jgi:hypothetical protein
MVIITNPIGDFPLNDDWTYAKTVQALVETGQLKVFHTYASYLGIVPWGALFCLPFGFSFTALRISSLTLGLIGLWAVYGLLREVNARRVVAAVGSLSVAANPVFFVLSNTFMTDAPFLAFTACTAYCFAKALKSGSWLATLAGVIACCASATTRIFGLILPVAFLVGCIWKNGANRKSLFRGLLPLAITLAVLALCPGTFENVGRVFSGTEGATNWQAVNNNAAKILGFTGWRTLTTVPHLGLYCLPLLIITPWWEAARLRFLQRRAEQRAIQPKSSKYGKSRKRFAGKAGFSAPAGDTQISRRILPSLFVLTLLALLALVGWHFVDKIRVASPNGGNMLYDCGLGPPTLRDAYILGTAGLPTASAAFWPTVSVIGFVAGSLMALQLLRASFRLLHGLRERTAFSIMPVDVFSLVGFLVLYIGTCVILGILPFVDRYMLSCVPLLLAVLAATISGASRISRARIAIASVILLSYAVFAVGATHDYLSWNRARWTAIEDLIAKDKVSPLDIDGGYESNCWLLVDFSMVLQINYSADKSWWAYNDTYLVSFAEVPGVKNIRRYPYKRWMPAAETGSIYVGIKVNPWQPPPGSGWRVKDNPFVDKIAVCEDLSKFDGSPVGVSSVYGSATPRLLIAVMTKPGASEVDVGISVLRNGLPIAQTHGLFAAGSVVSGEVPRPEGRYISTGSYKVSIAANGQEVGELSFAVE